MDRALYSNPRSPDWYTVLCELQRVATLPSPFEKCLLSGALRVAARHDRLDVAQLLLSRGANLNASGADVNCRVGRFSEAYGKFSYEQSALRICAGHGSERVARLLLERGVDVSGDKAADAMKASALSGHVLVLRLVACAAGPDSCRGRGETALHFAGRNGLVESARVLLECGSSRVRRTASGLDFEGLIYESYATGSITGASYSDLVNLL